MTSTTSKSILTPLFAILGFALLWSLPVVAQNANTSEPVDASLHKSGFVKASGIQLHYLEWGTGHEVLLLLAGQGYDAHAFDGFAERFTDRYRVIALTRRGYGESDVPKSGYDTTTRVEDIRRFLDALKIKKVSIAAHSMGGSETTVFASIYPGRVKRLVYLDAAIDHTCYAKVEFEPWLSADEKRRRLALRSPLETTEDIIAELSKLGIPRERWEANKATDQAVDLFQPNYSKVKAPALVIYRRLDRYSAPPGLPEATRKEMDAWWMKNGYRCAMQSRKQFQEGMRRGEVAEIQSVYHDIFVGPARNEVVPLMRDFLLPQYTSR